MQFHSRPITKREADSFVLEHHRHHNAAYLTIFNVAAYFGDKLVGGRNVLGRMLDACVTGIQSK